MASSSRSCGTSLRHTSIIFVCTNLSLSFSLCIVFRLSRYYPVALMNQRLTPKCYHYHHQHQHQHHRYYCCTVPLGAGTLKRCLVCSWRCLLPLLGLSSFVNRKIRLEPTFTALIISQRTYEIYIGRKRNKAVAFAQYRRGEMRSYTYWTILSNLRNERSRRSTRIEENNPIPGGEHGRTGP